MVVVESDVELGRERARASGWCMQELYSQGGRQQHWGERETETTRSQDDVAAAAAVGQGQDLALKNSSSSSSCRISSSSSHHPPCLFPTLQPALRICLLLLVYAWEAAAPAARRGDDGSFG